MRTIRLRLSWLVPAVALAAAVVGCGSGSSEQTKSTAAPPKPATSATEVTVAEVRADALDAAVAGYKDKVVVVDFWATWCAPCVKKFPHLVALHEKYADGGLVCVSVSMDKLGPPEDYQHDKVLAFLKDKRATFPNFIAAEPEKDEKAIATRFGEFSGIPYMAIFDKAGRRAWDSGDAGSKVTDEQIDKKIEELLAK